MDENRQVTEIIYAEIPRRLASFFIDIVVTNILFVIGLYLLNLTTNKAILKQMYTSYATASGASSSLQTLATSLLFGYFFVFSLYIFISLWIFNMSVGMLATNIRFVTSDAQGNPMSLSLPQKFLRGFISYLLTFLLVFIPAIPWPFSKEKTSFIDFIARTFSIQRDKGVVRTIISYLVIALFVLVYVYLSGIQ